MMAKTVATKEEIELHDGKVVVARSLSITKMKEAMAYLENESTEAPETINSGMDFIVGLVVICIGNQLEEGYALEDNLDTPSAKRIIFVCTGIDFDDENLVVAAAVQAAQNGATST
jgi:tRNA(Ser,Leu) C12 N-acetylase TAN1